MKCSHVLKKFVCLERQCSKDMLFCQNCANQHEFCKIIQQGEVPNFVKTIARQWTILATSYQDSLSNLTNDIADCFDEAEKQANEGKFELSLEYLKNGQTAMDLVKVLFDEVMVECKQHLLHQKKEYFLNTKQLLLEGISTINYVTKKYDQLSEFPVHPQVNPGFLRQQLSDHPPEESAKFEKIIEEVDKKIFPGLTLWNHSKFFAYYPSTLCHEAIQAEIFASAFGSPGFLWTASPSQTELENILVDWMVSAFGLPEQFLMKNSGGGTIAETISDAIFISIHAAKFQKIKELSLELNSSQLGKFVGYVVESAHSCASKGLHLKDIHYERILPLKFDEEQQNYICDIVKANQIIQQDIKDGLIPFWLGCSFGTTGTCAFDPITELGEICQKNKIWFNVDAAYAGASWIFAEKRPNPDGLNYADSIQINFAKIMMGGFAGSFFYVKDKFQLMNSLGKNINFEIYKNKYSECLSVCDYKDWQVALARRFNSFKIFWILKSVGLEGLRGQAEYFASLVHSTSNFKVFTRTQMALVTFILIKPSLNEQNLDNRALVKLINETGIGMISGSEIEGVYFLRVSISSHSTTKEILLQFWKETVEIAEKQGLIDIQK